MTSPTASLPDSPEPLASNAPPQVHSDAHTREPRSIPVRHPEFSFDDSIPRHWMSGNPVATHVFNGMNLVFPDGERFFIDSVRAQLPKVQDPALRAEVRAFFGQEGKHAAEHERYFETLRSQGYEVDGFLTRFRAFCRWMSRRLPAPLRLSVTAGAEHYTATFGFLALEDPLIDGAHPTMRHLILWHALEEIEHKAVAFDVLQETHPSYLLRLLGFGLATLSLFGWAAVAARMLMRHDGLDGKQIRRHRAELWSQRSPQALRELRRRVFAYLRPGFHPDQEEDLPQARQRLAEIGYA